MHYFLMRMQVFLYPVSRQSLVKYQVHLYITSVNINDDLYSLATILLVTSTGLAKTHHSSKLGKYREIRNSKGRILYSNDAGYYLHFVSDGTWVVSITYDVLIASLVNFSLHTNRHASNVNYFNLQSYYNYNKCVLFPDNR